MLITLKNTLSLNIMINEHKLSLFSSPKLPGFCTFIHVTCLLSLRVIHVSLWKSVLYIYRNYILWRINDLVRTEKLHNLVCTFVTFLQLRDIASFGCLSLRNRAKSRSCFHIFICHESLNLL